MSTFERKYSADEKEAAVYAVLDRRIRPQKTVVDLAKRGELITRDGRTVRPFELNPYTLRSWCNVAKRKRNGRIPGAAYENPEGTIEALRRRMIAVADSELAHAERTRTGKRDPAHLREIARLVREVAAIPKPGEGRGKKPGADHSSVRTEGETRSGMAASLLRAHRARPAPEPLSQQERPEDTGDARINARSAADTDTETNEPKTTQNGSSPGRAISGLPR